MAGPKTARIRSVPILPQLSSMKSIKKKSVASKKKPVRKANKRFKPGKQLAAKRLRARKPGGPR